MEKLTLNLICELCGKEIDYRAKNTRANQLINIFNDSTKRFCSKTCKLNFIYSLQEKKLPQEKKITPDKKEFKDLTSGEKILLSLSKDIREKAQKSRNTWGERILSGLAQEYRDKARKTTNFDISKENQEILDNYRKSIENVPERAFKSRLISKIYNSIQYFKKKKEFQEKKPFLS